MGQCCGNERPKMVDVAGKYKNDDPKLDVKTIDNSDQLLDEAKAKKDKANNVSKKNGAADKKPSMEKQTPFEAIASAQAA